MRNRPENRRTICSGCIARRKLNLSTGLTTFSQVSKLSAFKPLKDSAILFLRERIGSYVVKAFQVRIRAQGWEKDIWTGNPAPNLGCQRAQESQLLEHQARHHWLVFSATGQCLRLNQWLQPHPGVGEGQASWETIVSSKHFSSPCVLPNRDGTVWTLLHCQRGISLYFCKQYFCAAIHHRIMLSKPVISESLFFFFKPPKSSLELWFASSPQLKARNYHTESVARSFCLVLGGGTVPSLCSFRVTVRTP